MAPAALLDPIPAYQPSIDELIASSRAPRVPWPRRQQATVTVTDPNGLQAAIDAARAGDVIALRGKWFAGFKVKKAWGQSLPDTWNPYDREAQVVTIVNGNPDGTEPIVAGFAIWTMNQGSELWSVDVGYKPAEWQDDGQWLSAPYCFGSWITGQTGTLRFKNCTFYAAEHGSQYGQGLKAGCRTTRMGLHFEDCRSAPGALAQEQWIYPDNVPLLVIDGCDFGACGRSHFQTGTRQQYAMPENFLGILVQHSKFLDGFCGSANAASNTVYGYPGLVVMLDNEITSNGWDGFVDGVQTHLDPTAGIAIWRAWNFGGAKLDPEGWATTTLVVDNVRIKIGPGKLDAVGVDATHYAHIRRLDTGGSAPGAEWVSIPGQYGLVGAGNVYLYGPPFPSIRTHLGDSTSKQYHIWTLQEKLAHLYKPAA